MPRLRASREAPAAARIGNAFVATPVAEFHEPWAMTFLPDGRLLVTEKKGALKLLDVETRGVGEIARRAHGRLRRPGRLRRRHPASRIRDQLTSST